MVPSYQNLSTIIPVDLPLSIDTVFHPVHDNSTDFVKCIPLQENRYMVVAGDVSGHSPESIQVAARFHNLIEKIQEEGISPLAVCKSFNEYLATQWNNNHEGDLSASITSLAASFIIFDLASNSIQLLSSGFPSPTLHTSHMAPMVNLGNASMPMGWFDPFEPYAHSTTFPAEGILYLWSNGLISHARKMDIHPLSLAILLLQTKDESDTPFLKEQPDDILLIKISWPKLDMKVSTLPLFEANYAGNTKDDIDMFQATWRKSIQAILPSLHKEKLNKILLCTREAILNALSHGCSLQNYLFSSMQMCISADMNSIFVRIQDEGTGFDPDSPSLQLARGLEDHVPLGLIIIKSLASWVEFSNNGSCLLLSFHLDKI